MRELRINEQRRFTAQADAKCEQCGREATPLIPVYGVLSDGSGGICQLCRIYDQD